MATDHPIKAYGGHTASRELLEALASELRAGALPMYRMHDIRRHLDASNIDAGIEKLEDGHVAVWAEFDVDQTEWEEFEQEVREAGAPGGFSFSYREYFKMISREPEGEAAFSIAGDASHFSDDQILSAGQRLAEIGPVKVGRLYEFSFEPSVKVVIELVLDHPVWTAGSALTAVGLSMLANALYDGLKRFLSKGKATTFNLITRRYADGTIEQGAHLETDSEDVLKLALEKLFGPDRRSGTLSFEEDSGEWRDLD